MSYGFKLRLSSHMHVHHLIYLPFITSTCQPIGSWICELTPWKPLWDYLRWYQSYNIVCSLIHATHPFALQILNGEYIFVNHCWEIATFPKAKMINADLIFVPVSGQSLFDNNKLWHRINKTLQCDIVRNIHFLCKPEAVMALNSSRYFWMTQVI